MATNVSVLNLITSLGYNYYDVIMCDIINRSSCDTSINETPQLAS